MTFTAIALAALLCQNPTPESLVENARAAMQTGDYAGAIGPLKKALEASPDLESAQQLLGFALLSAGYAEEAIPYLAKLRAFDALGVAQLEAGQYPEATANLREALEQRPGDVDLMYYLGRASGLLSQQAFESLRATDPASARAHQILGETYAVLHNTDAAEKEFNAALRLRPATRGIHLELGDLYVSVSQWGKAEAEFRAESQMQPGAPEPALKLGNALLQLGKAKEARKELEHAASLAPKRPDVLYLFGKAASLDGDKAAAEKAWLAALEADKDGPFAAQAHFGLAGVYRESGQREKAEAELKEFQRLQKPGR